MRLSPARTRHGFTLIELAIVLVVIGLVTGAIFVGQSMIRSSEMQSIAKDITFYSAAINNFRAKYGAMPGDMKNATSYWGVNANCTTGGAGVGTQTCDGDGNNYVAPQSSFPGEQYLFWQHLANAGMIPGTYTGSIVATGNYAYSDSGVNAPLGKLNSRHTYFFGNFPTQGPSAGWWERGPVQAFLVGKSVSPAALSYPLQPMLTPSEAFSLDSKVDDGSPAYGRWMSGTAQAGYNPNCVLDKTTGLAMTDGYETSKYKAIYNGSYSAEACAFWVIYKS